VIVKLGNKLFCPVCFNDESFTNLDAYEIYEIRGERFRNEIKKHICNNCGEEIIDDDIYDESLKIAFNKYRKKHNLLFPDQIREIRTMYGLSQRAFGRLLGWGEITINRYENDSLQDNVHDQLLKLIKKPENMFDVLNENKNNLSEKEYNKLNIKVKNLIASNALTENIIIKQLRSIDKNFTGNKKFDMDKFKNMVLFFSQNIDKLWKTKLIKLLFYSDFINYNKYSFSISGTPFVHWPYGPVPKHIYGLLELLTEDYKVIQSQEYYTCNNEGEIINANESFDENIFSANELETLDFVLNNFKNYTSSYLSDLTHKEKAYIKTANNELIPYEYAKELSITINKEK